MNRYYINLDHTSKPMELDETLYNKGSKTLFLTFCMHVTGIQRLFDEETAKEFLFRLALVFRHYNIVPKFFTDDTFIEFDDRGVKVELCLNDVKEHLGIELWDGATDLVDRQDWICKIDKYWRNACTLAIFTGIPILDKRVIGKNKFIIGSNKPVPITEECLKNAELFADTGIKIIGNEAFKKLGSLVDDRNLVLEEYRVQLAIKPKNIYDYDKIPLRIKRKAFRKLYGPIWRNKKFFEEEVVESKSTFALLLHLAWLWANGFMTIYEVCFGEDSAGYNAEVDERLDFEYEPYDGLNNLGLGINLYDTFLDYRLDRILTLLKEK